MATSLKNKLYLHILAYKKPQNSFFIYFYMHFLDLLTNLLKL